MSKNNKVMLVCKIIISILIIVLIIYILGLLFNEYPLVQWGFFILCFFALLIKLYYMYFSSSINIASLISKKINRRESKNEDEIIQKVASQAGVPVDYSKYYLNLLSHTYGISIDKLRPNDTFLKELNIEFSDLPNDLKSWKIKFPFLVLFEEFFWVWDPYNDINIDKDRINELIKHPEMTISELCKKLYLIENQQIMAASQNGGKRKSVQPNIKHV